MLLAAGVLRPSKGNGNEGIRHFHYPESSCGSQVHAHQGVLSRGKTNVDLVFKENTLFLQNKGKDAVHVVQISLLKRYRKADLFLCPGMNVHTTGKPFLFFETNTSHQRADQDFCDYELR